MEIYVIRHTAPAIEPGICYGQSDIGLQASFKNDSAKILKKIPRTVVAVYTSPLVRCKKLAALISCELPIPLHEDARLKELNFGDWEMKRWDEIETIPLHSWMTDYVNKPCPNGESYQRLYERVESFLIELSQLNIESAALVTHHGVMKCIHSYINKCNLSDAMTFNFELGGVYQFSLHKW